jgi:hypothetical protein
MFSKAQQRAQESVMGIRYDNLDTITRQFMLQETQLGGHYSSPRLTDPEIRLWVGLLEAAIQTQNDDWLASELLRLDLLQDRESYMTKNGRFWRRINKPSSATMLAEGEFNRYYLRGLCIRVLNENATTLLIYRGKSVTQPRPESEAKIGTHIDAQGLLDTLRRSDFVSVEDAFAVPGGPNSGLTACLPNRLLRAG